MSTVMLTDNFIERSSQHQSASRTTHTQKKDYFHEYKTVFDSKSNKRYTIDYKYDYNSIFYNQ